jgi:hypothetical protein
VGQFWIQDTSIASYEDKIVGMLNENRGGISRDTRTTFVESAPNSFFWGSLFASNDTLMTEEHSRVAGRVTKRLVSFPIAPNAYASRRVLLTSSANFNFFELAAHNKLVCYTEYQATRNGLAVVVLNTNTGRKLTLATDPNGDIGWCAIPVDNLVMWISYGKYGFVLNGYDATTGKSGSLPLSAGVSLYSFASTELGSVAWIELFQKGTRIVELNGASFKKYINTVNPSPSPSPTLKGVTP